VRAAAVIGVIGTVFAAMQFLSAPVLGVISDQVGRKPVLILSTLGLAADYVVMALAPSFGWLVLGRTMSGITSASFATASAYVVDVTPAEKRAGAFAMLGATFGVGFIVGPAIGGFLGGIDPRLPFWAAAALSLLNALYGLLVLPESLPAKRRNRFTWSRANPLGALRLLRRHRELSGLATVTFMSILASVALQSTFVIYTQYRYGWDARMLGWSLAWVGICSFAMQGLVVGPFVKRAGERVALYTGLVCGAVALAGYGLAPSGLWIFVATPVLMLWGLASSAAQQIMTRHVGPNEQGELQGAIQGIRSAAFLVGPFLFSGTLSIAIGPLAKYGIPGAPWFLSAAILLGASIPAYAALREEPSTA
jgi:DHA1 family tetracycline resistance protein-like MFS transporter